MSKLFIVSTFCIGGILYGIYCIQYALKKDIRFSMHELFFGHKYHDYEMWMGTPLQILVGGVLGVIASVLFFLLAYS